MSALYFACIITALATQGRADTANLWFGNSNTQDFSGYTAGGIPELGDPVDMTTDGAYVYLSTTSSLNDNVWKIDISSGTVTAAVGYGSQAYDTSSTTASGSTKSTFFPKNIKTAAFNTNGNGVLVTADSTSSVRFWTVVGSTVTNVTSSVTQLGSAYTNEVYGSVCDTASTGYCYVFMASTTSSTTLPTIFIINLSTNAVTSQSIVSYISTLYSDFSAITNYFSNPLTGKPSIAYDSVNSKVIVAFSADGATTTDVPIILKLVLVGSPSQSAVATNVTDLVHGVTTDSTNFYIFGNSGNNYNLYSATLASATLSTTSTALVTTANTVTKLVYVNTSIFAFATSASSVGYINYANSSDSYAISTPTSLQYTRIRPYAMCRTAAGRTVIMDYDTSVIGYQMSDTNHTTFVFGNQQSGPTNVANDQTNAEFWGPLQCKANGEAVYVVDYNNRIFKITYSSFESYSVTTVADATFPTGVTSYQAVAHGNGNWYAAVTPSSGGYFDLYTIDNSNTFAQVSGFAAALAAIESTVFFSSYYILDMDFDGTILYMVASTGVVIQCDLSAGSLTVEVAWFSAATDSDVDASADLYDGAADYLSTVPPILNIAIGTNGIYLLQYVTRSSTSYSVVRRADSNLFSTIFGWSAHNTSTNYSAGYFANYEYFLGDFTNGFVRATSSGSYAPGIVISSDETKLYFSYMSYYAVRLDLTSPTAIPPATPHPPGSTPTPATPSPGSTPTPGTPSPGSTPTPGTPSPGSTPTPGTPSPGSTPTPGTPSPGSNTTSAPGTPSPGSNTTSAPGTPTPTSNATSKPPVVVTPLPPGVITPHPPVGTTSSACLAVVDPAITTLTSFSPPGNCLDLAHKLYDNIGDSCLNQADAIVTTAFELADVPNWPGFVSFCSESRNSTLVGEYCTDGDTGADAICDLWDKVKPSSSAAKPIVSLVMMFVIVLNMML